jgi:hypothetical protein
MINLKDIISQVKKYHYFIYNNINYNINLYKSNKDKLKINIKNNEILILVTLKTITKTLYEKEKTSPIKISGGPLYGEVNTYRKIDGKLEKDKPKYKNKVYFTKKYLKKFFIKKTFDKINKDIRKIAKKYIKNKINQGLLAINTINNI